LVESAARNGGNRGAGGPRGGAREARAAARAARSGPAATRRVLAVALGVAVSAAAAVVLLSGGDAEPEPSTAAGGPAAVPALEAEMRLELRYGGPGQNEATAVRCPRSIEPGRVVRCVLRYPDGIPRAMLVRLSPRGELEADIPYPATLRR
jgi:hypothetical protein